MAAAAAPAAAAAGLLCYDRAEVELRTLAVLTQALDNLRTDKMIETGREVPGQLVLQCPSLPLGR